MYEVRARLEENDEDTVDDADEAGIEKKTEILGNSLMMVCGETRLMITMTEERGVPWISYSKMDFQMTAKNR